MSEFPLGKFPHLFTRTANGNGQHWVEGSDGLYRPPGKLADRWRPRTVAELRAKYPEVFAFNDWEDEFNPGPETTTANED